jgi:hypothetical protein
MHGFDRQGFGAVRALRLQQPENMTAVASTTAMEIAFMKNSS